MGIILAIALPNPALLSEGLVAHNGGQSDFKVDADGRLAGRCSVMNQEPFLFNNKLLCVDFSFSSKSLISE